MKVVELTLRHYLARDKSAKLLEKIQAVKNNCSDLCWNIIKRADLSIKSRLWNDSKVSAHLAIIPTARNKATERFSTDEKNINALVAWQYIAQFHPAFEIIDKPIHTAISAELFINKQKDIVTNGIGW